MIIKKLALQIDSNNNKGDNEMKLVKITSRNRRDFTGEFKCEACNHIEESGGYDDAFFHEEATPKFKCKNCGESTNSLNLPAQQVSTKYAEGEQV